MGVLPLPLPLLLLAAGTQASGETQASERVTDGHLDLGRCRFALGMGDGSIPDSHISASSAWSDSTAAHHARLGRSDGDGAWCPAGPVFPAGDEFLEVDLGRLHLVTLVGTQGRDAGGHGREFAGAYGLHYSRDRHRWLRWRDRWGQQVIEGNEDPRGVVLKDLSPPLVARALRVYPRAPRAMSVCLRIELYGCPWDAGLVSYTAPQGQVMTFDPAPIVLNDSTYDGFSVGGLQFGGLGQLADGALGLDDFRRSRERRLWAGYDYVGWSRPPGPRPLLPMEFQFLQLRRFRAMQVHCNNMRALGVAAFREVACRFRSSAGGAWDAPLTHRLGGAGQDPRARSVTVPLRGRRGRFVQCRFAFAARWLLFSEVTFHSEVVEEVGVASGWPPAPPPDPSAVALASPEVPWPGDTPTNGTTPAPGAGQPVAKAEHSQPSILIGCLVAIILLLLAVIVLILWRQHWRRILGKARRRPWQDELRAQLSAPGDAVVINNATGAGRGPPRYERVPPAPGDYQEPAPPRPTRPPPPTAPAPLANPAYRLLLATYAQPMGGLARTPPDGAKPINTDGLVEPEGGAGAYAEADVTGGSAYALAGPAPGPAPSPALPAFPRRRLRFREKLGEGQFGEVLLCEVEDPQALPPSARPPELPPGRPLLVAVKVLRPDASKNARRDFLQEARTLGRLRDPHIVRLLGVVGGAGPLAIVTEYMEHGDLHQFLAGAQGHALSLGTLLRLGAQIAAGMRFLAARNFVHRDLATRNCLVGSGFRVKVADFGMSRQLYARHYYRVRGRALLPIRWMAWECILLGTFTPASDAWAFGVTLWEVLTRCREQPYGALSDEQVIGNARRHCQGLGAQEYLPRPPGCPPALHELMLSCWAREAPARPDFGQLHRSLCQHLG
ncbi:epithelial discoidin domain-containing receptor 1 [Columba livia]|uniref:epithelial discoidin domain-containing receptor 1 n=1 Tax=Columba livia TaxID=8932 RepID=UPI0031BA0263